MEIRLTNRILSAAALSAAILLPAALGAQAARPVNARATAPAAAGASSSAREMMAEMQRIQARLQAVHNQVMQDPALRTAQESLMRDVKAAMLRADPGLDAAARRVEAMQQQVIAAQQRRDMRALQQLNTELAPIQQRFMRAQEQVMRQPGIATRARQLETQLHQRMLRVEPDTDRLLERGKQLQARLIRLQQAGVPVAPRN
jgi:Skp family chaperone for outer membrane proteins